MQRYIVILLAAFISCKNSEPKIISPDVITESLKFDSDDPAIWINQDAPSESIVFGTDKETDGAIYAFDLDGKIIESKTIRNLKRPNNIDIEYGFRINDSVETDILVATERERQKLRIFSVPDMQILDDGGIDVFTDADSLGAKLPMGVALYKSPESKKTYAIVSRKYGPIKDYLYQYELKADGSAIQAELVRKFGNFSGKKEIEAIAVDDELGFVYYSDEMHCIRKYHAEPAKGNEELNCFGAGDFMEDIEGIAIAKNQDTGFLIVSNQQAGTFNIYDRLSNKFIKEINLSTSETDGCEVVTNPLGERFPYGLFVAMNDSLNNFYFYDLKRLELKK